MDGSAAVHLKEFQDLVRQVHQGSEEAAWKLLEYFGPHVIRVIRRKLSRELRPKYDSGDFAQAVWLSFFAHRSRITQFTRPEQLVRFLYGMTRNKLAAEYRRHFDAAKRDVRREELPCPKAAASAQVAGHGPRPSEFAMARERWEGFRDRLEEDEREILRMRYLGRTNQEIAQSLGISERTVRRVMDKLWAGVAT